MRHKDHEPHIFGKHHCGFIYVGDGYGYWEYLPLNFGHVLLSGFYTGSCDIENLMFVEE